MGAKGWQGLSPAGFESPAAHCDRFARQEVTIAAQRGAGEEELPGVVCAYQAHLPRTRPVTRERRG